MRGALSDIRNNIISPYPSKQKLFTQEITLTSTGVSFCIEIYKYYFPKRIFCLSNLPLQEF